MSRHIPLTTDGSGPAGAIPVDISGPVPSVNDLTNINVTYTDDNEDEVTKPLGEALSDLFALFAE